MKIKFSDHAKERLKSRKISKKRVFMTLDTPNKSLSSFRGRGVFQKAFKDKVLEVVVKVENDTIIIVTAYYLYES